MTDHDLEYIELLNDVYYNGTISGNRTDTNTRKVFGNLLLSDLNLHGFNLLSSKFVNVDSIMTELHWFCDGNTNIGYLNEQGVNIWNQWADSSGNLGPVYGNQWREREEIIRLEFTEDDTMYRYLSSPDGGDGRGKYTIEETMHSLYFRRKFDQLQYVIDRLKTNPDCRRLIVDAWNTTVLPVDGVDPTQQASLGRQALAPCHTLFQFGSHEEYTEMNDRMFHNVNFVGNEVELNGYIVAVNQEEIMTEEGFLKAFDSIKHKKVKEQRVLDMVMFQRSMDVFIGAPYNMASYAALLAYVSALTGHVVGTLKIFIGDSHIYANHKEAINKQLDFFMGNNNDDGHQMFVTYNVPHNLKNMSKDNYRVFGYVPGPKIPAPVAK